ncbi:MAG TPA: sigma-70 family RNA polymerase sigma factor [Actinoplanes sp.]|jgi:RNA polymerase sigma factor (sigma-70 family)
MADSEADTTVVRDTAGLVAAAQAGSDEALAELIRAHLPLVYNIVGRSLNWHVDVDDVVQETMIQVMRALPGLREPDRFRSWASAIARQQIQLYLRGRMKIRQRREDIPHEQPDPSGDFAERTVSEMVLAAQRRDLTEAATWLDDEDRRLLSLLWQESLGQLTRSEVAAALTVSPKLAGVRLRRMKAQLDALRGVVRALRVSPRCPDLAGVVRPWNGVANAVWRKRLIRHVRDCPRCGVFQRGLVAPEELLLGVTSLPVATAFAAQTGMLSSMWAGIQNLFANKLVAGTAALTVAAGGGFAYAVYETPAPRDEALPVVRPTTAPSAVAPNAGGPSAAATGSAPPPSARALLPTGVVTADIFVAPDGSDAGAGTIARPYASLAKAVAAVQPGQTIALRGGTYRLTATVEISTSGSAGKRITLSNYRGERPVIDASGVPADKQAVIHRASYWTVQGLEIKNSLDHAYFCRACGHNVFQRLSIHDNVRSALTLRDAGTVDNQILDSDFFNNYDPGEGGNAGIGLGIKDGSGAGNLIRGNRAFNNADNGFDLGKFSTPVTVEGNWAFGNGVNRWNVEGFQSNGDGFHLGGGNPPPAAAHILRNNAAWDNVGHGFSTSGNRGAMRLTNNTAFRNGHDGFYLADAVATVNDNAAVGNGGDPAVLPAGATQRGNNWQAGLDLFRSTDPSAAQGPRAAGGALPRVDFLVSTSGVGATMSASAPR